VSLIPSLFAVTTLEISILSGDSQGKTTQSSVPKMVIVYFEIQDSSP